MASIREGALPGLVRNRKRFEKIVATLAKYGLADWIRDWNPDSIKNLFRTADGQAVAELAQPVRLRMALTELGTTFIKLGQSLSTRADLIGLEMAKELEKLQSDTPADSSEQMRATILAELGKPPEELFAEFEPEALASASIAQVHAATLHDGSRVVVKVQHHGIQEKVRGDLEILEALAKIAEKHSPELRLYQPTGLAAEFRRTLLKELDFKREERNLLQFARNFEGDSGIHFPIAYPELSSVRVLVMERLDGFSVAESERLDEAGVDSKVVAERGANAYLEMIFRDGYYHADPHPGNILVLAGGVVGFLDCGMVGRLDDRMREHFENLLMAAVDKDGERLTDVVLKIGTAPPDLDREALETDVNEFADDFTGVDLTNFDLGATITAGTEIVRRYRIILRPPISLLFKALVMLEGTSRLVDRSFSIAEMIEPYYEKIVRRRFAPKKLARHLQRSFRDWQRLLDLLPGEIASILDQVQRGTVRVHLEHRRLDATVNRLVYGVLSAALFLGSAQMLSRQVPPLLGDFSMLGVAGLVAATLFTVRLVRAVKTSGGLSQEE